MERLKRKPQLNLRGKTYEWSLGDAAMTVRCSPERKTHSKGV